jgi:hypothetical protein
MKSTHLKRTIEAFIKDEYNLKDVNIEISVLNAAGHPENFDRLMHDATNESDYDENQTNETQETAR